MIVLIGIALILLLLLVVPSHDQPAQTPGWTGFIAGPSTRSTDRDDVRVANDLQAIR